MAITPLQIPLPGGSGVACTGQVQFQNDWPGLFVRGDHAMIITGAIRHLQKHLAAETDQDVLEDLDHLAALADIVERYVIVKDQRAAQKSST